MHRSVKVKETLVYYDGAQLFVGRDQLGTLYLCLLIERLADLDRFVCVPVSPERLRRFRQGEIDLREIYERPESEETYLGELAEEAGTALLKLIGPEELREEWLPDGGFFFERAGASEEAIVEQARERNRAVVHLSVSPPESREETKISISHLLDTLSVFETVLKYAFKKAISGVQRATRSLLGSPENYCMDVFGFSPGSFTIHLQSKGQADMLGYVYVAEALKKLDELTAQVADPPAALRVVQENRGHLAGSYLKLLECIVKNDAPLSYVWTIPGRATPEFRRITRQEALPIYETLSERRELTAERREFEGHVCMANAREGTWTILSDKDKKAHSGTIEPGTGLTLAEIVIQTQGYRFTCNERIEQIIASGREKRSLALVNYERI